MPIAPEPWKHETGELVLSTGGVAEVGFSLVVKPEGRTVEVKLGKNVLDTGRYTLTFTRPHAVDQTEDIVLVTGKEIKKEPSDWKPLPTSLTVWRDWAFEQERAKIQNPKDLQLQEPPESDVSVWIKKAYPTNTLLQEKETEQLKILGDVYFVFNKAPSEPLPENQINALNRLHETGYKPNDADVKLVRSVLKIWEEQNTDIQSRPIRTKTKEEALQRVETLRKLSSEFEQFVANKGGNK